MKKFGVFLIILALALFVCSGVLASTSLDKANNYAPYADDSAELPHNAYVKGDSYNYIINGTHFTAYAVFASACGIGGLLCLIGGGLMVCLHGKMDVIALQAARNALDVAREHGGPVKKQQGTAGK